MNYKEIIVWDAPGKIKTEFELTYLWSDFNNKKNQFSIPKIVEEKSDTLRADFLKIIHSIGELNIKGKSLKTHLVIDEDFSFWWMSLIAEKNYLKSPRIYDCLRLLALSNELKKTKSKRLVLVSHDATLAQAIKICSDEIGINFKWEKLKGPNTKFSIKNIYRWTPYKFQGIIFFLVHIIKRWSLTQAKTSRWFSGEKSIFFFSYFAHLDQDKYSQGRYYSKQWTILPSVLEAVGQKLNFLHHFNSRPGLPNEKKGVVWCKKVNSRGSQEIHSFLDSYLNLTLAVKSICDFFKMSASVRSLESDLKKDLLKTNFYFLWPLLKKDWNHSFHGWYAARNFLFIHLIRSVIKKLPKQSLGLYLYEGQSWENAFLHFWNKYGHGRVIGVSHSTVSYWYLNYFNHSGTIHLDSKSSMPTPDAIAVNGIAMRTIMENGGHKSQSLFDVEALRFLHLNYKSTKTDIQLEPVSKIRVLIIGDYQPSTNNSALSLINQLNKVTLKKIDITFKPHPAYPGIINWKQYSNLNINITDKELYDIFKITDLVISPINSAAAIEAQAYGFNVITILERNQFNASPLRGLVNSNFFVSSAKELDQILEQETIFKCVSYNNTYFWTDKDLPKWKALITNHINKF